MQRIPWRYWLNVALFADICSIAAIGVLLAFFIPEGPGGRSGKYFLGLHRHTWGDIHLNLSVLLLLLLVCHLRYNWRYITQSTQKYFGGFWQKALWGIGCSWIAVLAFAWLLAML